MHLCSPRSFSQLPGAFCCEFIFRLVDFEVPGWDLGELDSFLGSWPTFICEVLEDFTKTSWGFHCPSNVRMHSLTGCFWCGREQCVWRSPLLDLGTVYVSPEPSVVGELNAFIHSLQKRRFPLSPFMASKFPHFTMLLLG